MKFSERIQRRIKSLKEFKLLNEWIAENLSRYPAMTENLSWLPHYNSAKEAEIILFLGLYRHPWEVWEIVARIRESCYFHRYSGEWKQVQEILERVTDLGTFEENLKILMSEDDFFGNFLKNAEDFLRREFHSFKPVVRDRRRPKRLIRHRGYRDKGSLRPYHQRGRNLPEENPPEDRRGKVRYSNLPDI